MSLENESYPLKELNEGASVFSGFAFRSKDFVDEGIPVVKIKNIQNKAIDLSDIQFFSLDNLNDKHEKFLLKNNDVLIAMTGQGSLGRVGRLKLDNNQLVLLNQRVGKFITDEENLHLNYLYHVISSDMYEKILFDRGTGSGQPNLSPEIILGTEIPMPDFNTQKKIALILDNIDDLIILNKKINKNFKKSQFIFETSISPDINLGSNVSLKLVKYSISKKLFAIVSKISLNGKLSIISIGGTTNSKLAIKSLLKFCCTDPLARFSISF